VADLCLHDCLEYVEYEWFEGGMLVVATHTFLYDGDYTSRFVVFGPESLEKSSDSRSLPSKVLLTLSFVETAV
jgi:hypothetical protein